MCTMAFLAVGMPYRSSECAVQCFANQYVCIDSPLVIIIS